MSKGLKTLKDIDDRKHIVSIGIPAEDSVVKTEILRQVAREWIDWMDSNDAWGDIPDKDKATHERRAKGLAPVLYNKNGIIYWIKYFFNLEGDE